jgi:hypothetical protein
VTPAGCCWAHESYRLAAAVTVQSCCCCQRTYCWCCGRQGAWLCWCCCAACRMLPGFLQRQHLAAVTSCPVHAVLGHLHVLLWVLMQAVAAEACMTETFLQEGFLPACCCWRWGSCRCVAAALLAVLGVGMLRAQQQPQPMRQTASAQPNPCWLHPRSAVSRAACSAAGGLVQSAL